MSPSVVRLQSNRIVMLDALHAGVWVPGLFTRRVGPGWTQAAADVTRGCFTESS
jgi:hypothetical protein